MATPTKGNTTNANPTPASNSHSFTHNQNSGSNKLLIAMFTMSNTRSFSGATYGGNAMTELYQQNRGGLSQRMVFYYLENPPDGNNTLQVNFSGNQFNPISVHARSFTDSGGVGAHGNSGASSTPNNKTLTVEQDSLIIITSCSNNTILTQQIPSGTSRTFTTHNTNKQVGTGAISADTGHSAGSISLRATAASGTVTLDRVEIKGIASPTVADNRILFYGAAILADVIRFYGASIVADTPRFYGASIVTNNYMNGNILVIDGETAEPISGATVSIISTQTNPIHYVGDISGSTDSNGIFIATGSSTTGTTLTIEADGFTTYNGPLTSTDYDFGLTIPLFKGGASKKIYTTNKGNILINPNDTILIEL